MEFKFNVQAELFCNKDGYSTLKLDHLLREEYENTNLIMDVILKMRQLLLKVSNDKIQLQFILYF